MSSKKGKVPYPITNDDRREASKLACALRHERRAIKDKLKAGEIQIGEVLAGESKVTSMMRVFDVIRSMPGYGNSRATTLMDRLRISKTRRVRGLGSRQKDALIKHFETK